VGLPVNKHPLAKNDRTYYSGENMKSEFSKVIVPSMRRSALICSGAVLAALGGLNPVRADPGMTNLALGKTATATESDFGGLISYGVDGNRDGNFNDHSVFYGNADPNNPPLFYQVDLGANQYVNRIQFLPRTDADQNVFGPINISLYPDDGTGHPAATPSFSQDYNSGDSVYFGDSFATADPGAAAPGGANGRFARITRLDNNYWLTFAEMEVIGSPNPLHYTQANNLAANKPVTASSPPGFGALIISGNDGNISGDFNTPSRPVYHSSNHSVGEYWQVDLGADTTLAYSELFTRAGKDNGNTTHQFDVQVFDSSMNLVKEVIVDNADVNGPTPDFDHAIDLAGYTGRYIRVATTTDSYLAFSELQAFAALTWNNTGGSGDGLHWDTTSQNWHTGTSNDFYTDGLIVVFNDTNNSHYSVTINSIVKPLSTTVDCNGSYTFTGTGGIGGAGSLTKRGPGFLTISTVNTYTGGTTVQAGTLLTNTNLSNGTLTVTGGTARVSQKPAAGDATGTTKVPALTITGTGVLDLTNNALIVDYSGASPLSTIRSLLVSGYNSGSWTGTGITSSTAASVAANPAIQHKTALGYAEASALGLSTFVGQDVDSTAVLVRYTLYGDANLDGTVDTVDFNLLASSFSATGKDWFNGDFNYDGSVDTVDFNLLAANFGQMLSAPSPAIGSLVPEPASLLSIGLIAAGSVVRRRRRRIERELKCVEDRRIVA
jgi:autotransporter-associated beta strand protein